MPAIAQCGPPGFPRRHPQRALIVVSGISADNADIPESFLAVPPHAQSLAARDGDEWREGTDSISEMLFLAVEFHLVLLCTRDLVEGQGQLP